jgi:hypothetical protein
MTNLLVRLELAGDILEFHDLLRDIRAPDRNPDQGDRARSRWIVSNDYWYDNVRGKFEDAFSVTELAGIFQAAVLPDLAEPEVMTMLTRWSAYAPPPVIAGLLAAAKGCGVGEWQAMMRILQPVLALRWLADSGSASLWDSDIAAEPRGDDLAVKPEGEEGRGRRGFWRR